MQANTNETAKHSTTHAAQASADTARRLDIKQRKGDHLDLCATDEVAFRKQTNLLGEVKLVHQSLPDLDIDAIDMRVSFLGKTLRAPIFIAAMTGGTGRAADINRVLSGIADRRGYGFGLGSQRAMQKDPESSWTFQVREWAPNVLLLGNLGTVQAREASTEAVQQLVDNTGADGLCVHMNPAMEIVQPGGDRDFRDGTKTFARLAEGLSVPVVAKETGNGISPQTAQKLASVGVKYIDVSGAGGTSWVGVEALRATGEQRQLGDLLWDWGVPTAASVVFAAGAGMQTIATGGIRTGYDIARAIALGASAGGIARFVFQAYTEGGEEGAERFLDQVEQELRAVMLLCGAENVAALQQVPRVLGPELRDWVGLTAG